MSLLRRNETDEERAARETRKEAERQQRDSLQAEQRAAKEAERAHVRAFQETRPRWEYQVKRIGEDKQKGLLGSGRMKNLFNDLGTKGWELVAVNEERAIFKRELAVARPAADAPTGAEQETPVVGPSV